MRLPVFPVRKTSDGRGLGFRVLPQQAVPYSETLAQGLHDTVVFGLSPPLLHIYFFIPFSHPVPIADTGTVPYRYLSQADLRVSIATVRSPDCGNLVQVPRASQSAGHPAALLDQVCALNPFVISPCGHHQFVPASPAPL